MSHVHEPSKTTDPDLHTFPHVLLTGLHELDLDYTHPTRVGDPTWAIDPSKHDAHDPRIDEFGNLKGGKFTTPSLIPCHLQHCSTQTCYQNSTH